MLLLLVMLRNAALAACPNTSLQALADCYQATLTRPAAADSVKVQVDVESLGRITRVIDATPRRAADTLMRFEDAPAWFPDLRSAAILHRGADRIRVAGSSALPWPLGQHDYELDMTRVDYTLDGQPAALVAFRYVEGSGEIEALYGYWLLVSEPGGKTLVQYETHAALGFWLPEPLVGFFTGHTLPRAISGLEQAARG